MKIGRLTPLPLALGALAGSVLLLDPMREFALDDDWVFYLCVKSLVVRGAWEFPADTPLSLVAHPLWGWLFSSFSGLSHSVLRLSTLVLSGVALASLSLLAAPGVPTDVGGPLDLGAAVPPPQSKGGGLATGRRSGESPPEHPVFLLLANPLFFVLSFTFMTDVPFLAWSLLALALYREGERSSRSGWLVAGALAAGAAVWTRQIGIFAALAAGWCRISRSRLSAREAILILGIPVLCLAAAFSTLWTAWSSTAFVQEGLWSNWRQPGEVLGEIHYRWAASLLYLALFSLPAALALVRARGLTFPGPLPSIAALGFFTPLLLRRTTFPYLSGIIHDRGLGTMTLPDPQFKAAGVLGTPFFCSLLTAAAFLSLFIWLGRMKEFKKAMGFEEVRILAFSSLPQFAVLSMGPRLYDRYLLPLVPLALLWAHRTACVIPPESPKRGGGGHWPAMLAILFFAWSLLGTWDYLNWNSAKWEAGGRAAALGIYPEKLQNGWDWAGMHQAAPGGGDRRVSGKVSFSPMPGPGGAEVSAVPYWTPLSLSPGKVFLHGAGFGPRPKSHEL